MAKAIETNNLTKHFPKTSRYRDLLPFRQRQFVTAVNGVNLEIKEGEFFGLLGPNGAGKTTLIKLLCCLVLPGSGTARVFGHDILREEQAVKNLVGLVSSEERSFFWRLTGRENLQFFASLYHVSGPSAKKRIDELLDILGLSDEGDIRFQNYSTGMRQKLAIARGLLSQPQVLFVDEPTRSLDPVSAQTVRRFFKERVAGEGKTVILATHNLNEAEQLCDRLAIMDHGRVIALGTVRELRSLFQSHERCRLQVRHLSESILPQLRQIDGVLDCQVSSQHNGSSSLELQLFNRTAVLPQVLNIMVQNGAEIYDCQIRELPLEEIFVHALSGGDMSKEN
jgi:ABC-2 type transport system ATP-binding protein